MRENEWGRDQRCSMSDQNPCRRNRWAWKRSPVQMLTPGHWSVLRKSTRPPLWGLKSHLLTLWCLTRKLKSCVSVYCKWLHTRYTLILNHITENCIACDSSVNSVWKECSLRSRDDWVELNSHLLSCVQSNQLELGWLRWTYFTIVYTTRVVDTAELQSCVWL